MNKPNRDPKPGYFPCGCTGSGKQCASGQARVDLIPKTPQSPSLLELMALVAEAETIAAQRHRKE
jgi:hypothetical protein